jgi:hypothetical protein
MKTGPDAFHTAENVSGSAKHEIEPRRPRYRRKRVLGRKTCKRDPTPSESTKMSSGTQNMKTGPDALRIAENVSLSARDENGTRRRRYRRKLVRALKNMKTGPDAPGIAENESRSAQHENGTRRPRYHRQQARGRKHENRSGRPRYRRKRAWKRKT